MRLLWGGVFLGFALAGAPRVTAQEAYPPVTLPSTEQRVIEAHTGIPYKLYVGLPNDYEASEGAYPVVYLLDADYSFAIARNIVEHLSDRGHLGRAIVVGIAYDGPEAYRLNRTRDYTPTHVPSGGYGPEYQQVSGGGPAFRQFLADVLIPFIEGQYRASPRRVLVGHSYGGLFATWVALSRPDLFSAYIAVSPSLWYDDHMVFGEAERAADVWDDLPIRLYMAVGSREINSERDMVADLRRFASVLERQDYSNLALRWSVLDSETHNSVFPRALSDGLRFVLDGR